MFLRRCATALVWCLIPVGLHAQLPPLGIPKGMVRLEGSGQFAGANERYLDGTRQDLGADFSSPALGPTQLQVLDEPSRRVGVLIGSSGYQLNLGASEGFANQTRSIGAIGVGVGLSNRITVFGRVPIVRATSQRSATITAGTGDAGVNAASPSLGSATGQAAAQGFFTDFDNGLVALRDNIAAGVYSGDPAQLALAEQTLAGGVALRDSLFALVLDDATASPYLPIGASAAGSALTGRVTSLQSTLNGSLGVTSFVAPLPLPTANDATYDQVQTIALDPNGPYQYTQYTSETRLALGDIELGAALTLVDGWDRKSLGGVRVAIEGLVRLPTGPKAGPDDGYPAPFGSPGMDVQVQGAADVGRGNFGMRLVGGYLMQLASTVTARVAAPGTLLVPVTSRTDVSLNPGDEYFVGVTPFYRIARPAALLMGIRYQSRGDDGASYVGAPVPGVDANVLGTGTGYSTLHLTFGVNYSEMNGRAGSRADVPVDAGWYWDTVIAASGGRATKTTTIALLVRLYAKVW